MNSFNPSVLTMGTSYFDFNPAPETDTISPKTHGLIPVWGFGTVVASSHPKIHEGERVYGYFAPTRYLLLPVSPSDVNKHAFYVPRPHLPAGVLPDPKFWNLIDLYLQIVARIIKYFVALLIRSIHQLPWLKTLQCFIARFSGLRTGAKIGSFLQSTEVVHHRS